MHIATHSWLNHDPRHGRTEEKPASKRPSAHHETYPRLPSPTLIHTPRFCSITGRMTLMMIFISIPHTVRQHTASSHLTLFISQSLQISHSIPILTHYHLFSIDSQPSHVYTIDHAIYAALPACLSLRCLSVSSDQVRRYYQNMYSAMLNADIDHDKDTTNNEWYSLRLASNAAFLTLEFFRAMYVLFVHRYPVTSSTRKYVASFRTPHHTIVNRKASKHCFRYRSGSHRIVSYQYADTRSRSSTSSCSL